MTVTEGIDRFRFRPALAEDGSGRYRFVCRKAVLIVRLVHSAKPRRFTAADRVGFRIDYLGIAVEDLKTGVLREKLLWERIETLAAGEPETSNGSLFQG